MGLFELIGRIKVDGMEETQKGFYATADASEAVGHGARKAEHAVKGFAETLVRTGSASDAVNHSAHALAQTFVKGIGATIAIASAKALVDGLKELANELAKTASAMDSGLNKINKSADFSSAVANAEALNDQIKEMRDRADMLDAAWNFTGPLNIRLAGITDTMRDLADATQGASDQMLKLKAQQDRIEAEKQLKMSDEQRGDRKYELKNLQDIKKLEAIKDPNLRKRAEDDVKRKQLAEETLRINEKQAKINKDSFEDQLKWQKLVFDGEEKLAKNIEDRKNKSDQDRVDRQIKRQNEKTRQEMEDIDEKTKMESNADARIFDRKLRDAKYLRDQQKKQAQEMASVGGGLLGASQAGRQALDVARKQRARQSTQENFKAQEEVFNEQARQENARRKAAGISGEVTAQSMRMKEAERVAAAEAPTLAEQAKASMTGMSPQEIALQNVAAKQSKSGQGSFGAPAESTFAGIGTKFDTLSADLKQFLTTLIGAPLVTSGAGGSK